ncbi:MAG: LysM peptidoglycan-binding domain-containing M23 family metallopeptidase [Yoonia sp.]
MSISRILLTTATVGLLGACTGPLDFDLRDLVKGFDTSKSVENLPDRPDADDRGVISYPNYQVVVARKDDTMVTIAERLGLTSAALAAYNGIEPDVQLRKGELVALPTRVAEPSPATGAAQTGPIDVAAIATSALDRAGPQEPVAPTPTPATPKPTEPVRHKIARGETVFSVARLYDVPVRSIADWNGLGPELSVREGQFLLIPQSGQTAPAKAAEPEPAPAPGEGSETPVPPSATQPLPDETPSIPVPAANVPKAPDLGPVTAPTPPAATSTANTNARFALPVQGTIIRAYASGRNDGIDIGVPAGTAVKAAGSGTVAAVTTDTNGSTIVVIKHSDGLLTVYTNLAGMTVAKGASISKGQTIGEVREGNPSFVHFEVRRGLTSLDPAEFLP